MWQSPTENCSISGICRRISSVTRWTPRCWGLRFIFLWNQALPICIPIFEAIVHPNYLQDNDIVSGELRIFTILNVTNLNFFTLWGQSLFVTQLSRIYEFQVFGSIHWSAPGTIASDAHSKTTWLGPAMNYYNLTRGSSFFKGFTTFSEIDWTAVYRIWSRDIFKVFWV